MRHFLLAAVAAAAIATPAMAYDGSPYVGIEGGLLIPQDTHVSLEATYPTTTAPGIPTGVVSYGRGYVVDYKKGFDVDAIAGYDLGMFRVEGEVGYKRANVEDLRLTQPFLNDINDVYSLGARYDNTNFGGTVRVLSGMINGLIEMGDNSGPSGYFGGGLGIARVATLGDTDAGLAYQGIAGVRVPVTPNVDVGLKYRYFRTAKMKWDQDFAVGSTFLPVQTEGRFQSNSFLLSLVYNFVAPVVAVAPPAPPPPAPVAPATQTCPDGSVILATDVCPAPPPPPPAPEPTPERG